ncbi:hypothetical protein ACFVQB_14825 [Paenibacillus sp. NPDC057886]|uniref:hypothetical protein n=1 Tax=Paenibacillus sp. NPDC057886 TaxID=3346270 RepID=UPI00368419BA
MKTITNENSKLIDYFRNKSFESMINLAENFLLRPNDTMKLMGEEKFYQRKQAFETVLKNNYSATDLHKYYYELPTIKHGFCTFKRWKNKMYF